MMGNYLNPGTEVKIAFWNVTLGKSSPNQKKKTFLEWVAATQPDILILEEVSFLCCKDFAYKTRIGNQPRIINKSLTEIINNYLGINNIHESYSLVDYVNTRDKNQEGSTKCLFAYVKDSFNQNRCNSALNCKTLRLPGLTSIRAGLKLTFQLGQNRWELWGIHANASVSGGTNAVTTVIGMLEKNKNCIVGGDFNLDIQKASKLCQASGFTPCCPVSWQNEALEFTQWNRRGANIITTDEQKDIFQVVRDIPVTLSPNYVIDYVLAGESYDVEALRNCPQAKPELWCQILVNFDHCPVLYKIFKK